MIKLLNHTWQNVYKGSYSYGSRQKTAACLYITRTHNNLLVLLKDKTRKTVIFKSAGLLGTKGGIKVLNEFMEQIGRIIESIKNKGVSGDLELCSKGLSSSELGEWVKRLQQVNFNVCKLSENTPIPHNGGRVKKSRRL